MRDLEFRARTAGVRCHDLKVVDGSRRGMEALDKGFSEDEDNSMAKSS